MLAKPPPWFPGLNRAHPLAAGLRALWPFWEGAGEQAHDLQQHGRHFETDAPAYQTWRPTTSGIGATQQAPADDIFIPAARAGNVADLTISPSWTLSVASHLDNRNVSSYAGLLTCRQLGPINGMWEIYGPVNNSLRFTFNDGAYATHAWPAASLPIPPAYCHWTITGTPTTLRGFVNGTDYGPIALLRPIPAQSTDYGLALHTLWYNSPNYYYLGTVLLVSIWYRALSPAEVIAHHADPFALIRRPSGLTILAGSTIPPSSASLHYTARGEPLDYESPYT